MKIAKTTNKHNSQDGFTLVEVVLYIAVFSVVIGAIVGLAALTSLQRVQSQAIAEINYQGETDLSLINQTIKSASSITSPAAGSTASSLTLAMATSSINPTVFDSFNTGSINQLRISEGSPATVNYLTSSHVKLSGLTFTNAGLLGTKGSIQVQFTLTYNSKSTLAVYSYSKTFYGATSLQ